jgi:hypothetical protein
MTAATAGFSIGCSGASEEDAVEADEGELNQSVRQIAGEADTKAGTAKVDLSFTLKGTTVEAVRAAIVDPTMAFWKDLKRPSRVKFAGVLGADVKISRSGSAMFSDISRDGKTVRATMPFGDSGLKAHTGLELELAVDLVDNDRGFTLTAENSADIKTKLDLIRRLPGELSIDVAKKGMLKFEMAVTRVDGGVKIDIKQSVEIRHSQEKVARMLGVSFAAANLIDAKFLKK